MNCDDRAFIDIASCAASRWPVPGKDYESEFARRRWWAGKDVTVGSARGRRGAGGGWPNMVRR